MQYCKQTVESTFNELTILSSIFGFLPTRNFLNSLPLTPISFYSTSESSKNIPIIAKFFKFTISIKKVQNHQIGAKDELGMTSVWVQMNYVLIIKKILRKFIFMNKYIYKKIIYQFWTASPQKLSLFSDLSHANRFDFDL